MDSNTSGFPVHHQLPEHTQTHVHWVSNAIQPSHPLSSPSPPTLNLPQHQGLFQWVSSSHRGQNIGVSASTPVLPINIQDWFRLEWTGWIFTVQGTLKSLLQHHSSKTSILWHSSFFIVQLSHPYMITGKTIALTRQTFVGKVMSLLFNKLSRLVLTYLPRSKRLLISWLQSPSAVILEPTIIKPATVSTVSPSICHEVMGQDAMILVFFFLFFKFYFIFKLYNIVLVLPNIEMNPPQVDLCSPSWTLLPPPSPYPPSGSSQCTSPKHPVLCMEPGLGLVSYMILDMFQCHSPKSPHPLPLPQSP